MKSSGNRLKYFRKEKKRILFCVLMLIFPMIQFLIGYVAVNFNSFLLAFQQYDSSTATFRFVGFQNFLEIWSQLTETNGLWYAVKNSLIVWIVNLVAGTGFTILFSYYIYKKFLGHRVFKVLLFLPAILPGIVLTLIYQLYVNEALPKYLSMFGIEIGHLMTIDAPTRFPMAVLYGVFAGFGTMMLLYTGTMSQVSPYVIEAAKLDGVKPLQELWYLILPEILPLIRTTLITSVAALFVNQANLMEFYGEGLSAESQTVGYHLFSTLAASQSPKAVYGHVSALGLCCSVITFILTRIVMRIMDRLGDE